MVLLGVGVGGGQRGPVTFLTEDRGPIQMDISLPPAVGSSPSFLLERRCAFQIPFSFSVSASQEAGAGLDVRAHSAFHERPHQFLSFSGASAKRQAGASELSQAGFSGLSLPREEL